MQIEQHLWTLITNSDQTAYAEVFRLLYPRLFNYGRKFTTREDVLEDALQDVMLSIWNKREQIANIEFPVTYFFSSFRFILLARIRASLKTVEAFDEEGEPEFAIDQILIQKETDEVQKLQLSRAVAQLTSRQREAIFLRFYEGMSYEQVAQTMGITTKATYKIMARALDELRQKMQVTGSFLLMILSCR